MAEVNFNSASHSVQLTTSNPHSSSRHSTQRFGTSLRVSKLSYFVKRPKKVTRRGCLPCGKRRSGEYTEIEGADEGSDSSAAVLNEVSLVLPSGGMMAVLGNSGSGKTSLLDCIAQRTVSGSTTTGTVFMDCQLMTPALFRARGAYVMQDDTLLPFLTVRETLSYVLRLRLACSKQEREAKIDNIISELGLKSVEDSMVGGTEIRGISGGERRRVSIAIQLLIDPGLLLLDEPTSGLDSHTAHHLIVMLSQLAAAKRHTIMLTIHQPRSEMLDVFDKVMILSRGYTTYAGPAHVLVDYFTSIGHPCPAYTSPLDEYVDKCSVDTRDTQTMYSSMERMKELTEAYRGSDLAEKMSRTTLTEDEDPDSFNSSPVDPLNKRNTPNWLYKAITLASRMNVDLLRAKTGMKMRAFQMFIYGITLFIFVLRLGKDQQSIQDRSGVFYLVTNVPLYMGMLAGIALFPSLRASMNREVRDGLYSVPLFMLGYLVHMLPFVLLSSLLFSSSFYWATGFVKSGDAFVGFTVVVLCSQFIGEVVALLMLALFNSAIMANSMSALLFTFTSVLCSGYLRNIESMAKGFRYLTYMGAQKYAGEILAAGEFSRRNFTCPSSNSSTETIPCRFPTGSSYLAANFPHAEEDLHRNYACLFGFCVGLYLLAILMFSVKSTNKRRRQ